MSFRYPSKTNLSTSTKGIGSSTRINIYSKYSSSTTGPPFNVTPPGPPFVINPPGPTLSAPTAPTSLTATPAPDGTSVTLSFYPPASDGGSTITSYLINYNFGVGLQGSINPAISEISTLPSGLLQYTVTELINQVLYTFTVCAVNAIGNGDVSVSIQATPATQGLTAPQNLTAVSAGGASTQGGQVTLSWDPPAYNGGSEITGYTIMPSITSGNSVEVTTTYGNVTSATIKGLPIGLLYSFYVFASNNTTIGPNSNTVTGSIIASPGPPQNFTAVVYEEAGTVNLTWDSPEFYPPTLYMTGSAITEYGIVYTTDGIKFTTITPTLAEVSINGFFEYLVDGLSNVPTTFSVYAVNNFGIGVSSNSVTVTPYGVPGTPTSLQASPYTFNSGSLTLSWDAPEDDGGSEIVGYVCNYKYRVESLNAIDNPYTNKTVNSNSNSTSLLLTDLPVGAQISYSVYAINVHGNGKVSNTVNLAIPGTPSAPDNVSASTDTGNGIYITWDDLWSSVPPNGYPVVDISMQTTSYTIKLYTIVLGKQYLWQTYYTTPSELTALSNSAGGLWAYVIGNVDNDAYEIYVQSFNTFGAGGTGDCTINLTFNDA